MTVLACNTYGLEAIKLRMSCPCIKGEVQLPQADTLNMFLTTSRSYFICEVLSFRGLKHVMFENNNPFDPRNNWLRTKPVDVWQFPQLKVRHAALKGNIITCILVQGTKRN
jgi:hypothetical protein